jgi:hypothetical protein
VKKTWLHFETESLTVIFQPKAGISALVEQRNFGHAFANLNI